VYFIVKSSFKIFYLELTPFLTCASSISKGKLIYNYKRIAFHFHRIINLNPVERKPSTLHFLTLNFFQGGIAMPDHYYSNQPASKHDLQEITIKVRGVQLKLTTDAGVFSKNRLDPGTELLIEGLRLQPELHEILDLGCGYGPIGLTLAKILPNGTVYMSDPNERAIELAVMNAEINGIHNVVIRAGSGFTSFPNQKFDLVVTNPPIRAGKQVIYPLVEEAYLALKPNGWFAAVLLTRQGAKSFEDKVEAVFGNVTEWEKGGGYRVVAGQKNQQV
jgi:16S rRNA (guanine1207-N2)-methyltransferase